MMLAMTHVAEKRLLRMEMRNIATFSPRLDATGVIVKRNLVRKAGALQPETLT